MFEDPEVIEAPLSSQALGERYRAICEDPCYANVPGKIELDVWGRMLMSPASNYHSALQLELGARLKAMGGRAFTEASMLTPVGVLVADVAWASDEFMRAHQFETPYTQVLDVCVEIVSPANSRKELREKIDAYLAAGAREVWLVYPKSKRCEFYSQAGLRLNSVYPLELTNLFAWRLT